MTRKELERTTWAKEFKREAPESYATAIKIALDPNLRVMVHRVNQSGEKLWVIDTWVLGANDLYSSIWMDFRPTKKAALELCKQMGWKVAPYRSIKLQ